MLKVLRHCVLVASVIAYASSAPAREARQDGAEIDVELRLVALAEPSLTDETDAVPDSLLSVEVGQNYVLELWASDLGEVDTGLTSVYVDVVYPPAAAITGISHGSLFTLFVSGSVSSGLVDELGGSTLSPGVGMEPAWARIAILQVHAAGADTSVAFSLAPSTTGVAAYGRGVVPWSSIHLLGTTLAHGAFPVGDVNCDGAVNAFDIDPFVLALTDQTGYAAEFPACDYLQADCNADGVVNAFDIDPFITILTR